MKLEFKWEKPLAQIEKGLGFGKTLNLFAANESRRLMDPFVPRESNPLSKQIETYATNEAGYNHYTSGYAHYQYVGLLMLAPNGSTWAKRDEIKHYASPPTQLKYSKEGHALATSYWDEAMVAAHGAELIKSIDLYRKRLAI